MNRLIGSLITVVIVSISSVALAVPCPESLQGIVLNGEQAGLREVRELIASGDDAIYQQVRVHYARTPDSCLGDVMLIEAEKRNDERIVKMINDREQKSAAWATCLSEAQVVGYPIEQHDAVVRLHEDFEQFWCKGIDHPWTASNPFFTCPLNMDRNERARFYAGWWRVSGEDSCFFETPESAGWFMADMVDEVVRRESRGFDDPRYFHATSLLPNCY